MQQILEKIKIYTIKNKSSLVLVLFLVVIPVFLGVALLAGGDKKEPENVPNVAGNAEPKNEIPDVPTVDNPDNIVQSKNPEDPIYNNIPGEDRYLLAKRAKTAITHFARSKDNRLLGWTRQMQKDGVISNSLASQMYLRWYQGDGQGNTQNPQYTVIIRNISYQTNSVTGEREFPARVDVIAPDGETQSLLVTATGSPVRPIITAFNGEEF